MKPRCTLAGWPFSRPHVTIKLSPVVVQGIALSEVRQVLANESLILRKCTAVRLLSLDVSNWDNPLPTTSSRNHQKSKVASILERSQYAPEFLESSALELQHRCQTTVSQKVGWFSSFLDRTWDSTGAELTNCVDKCRSARLCSFGLRLHEKNQPSEVRPNWIQQLEVHSPPYQPARVWVKLWGVKRTNPLKSP